MKSQINNFLNFFNFYLNYRHLAFYFELLSVLLFVNLTFLSPSSMVADAAVAVVDTTTTKISNSKIHQVKQTVQPKIISISFIDKQKNNFYSNFTPQNNIYTLDVEIYAFSKRFQISLHRQVISNSCNFTGYVNKFSEDTVAHFNLCQGGLSGVFQLNLMDYVVQPIKRDEKSKRYTIFKPGAKLLPHFILYGDVDKTVPVFTCKTIKPKITATSKADKVMGIDHQLVSAPGRYKRQSDYNGDPIMDQENYGVDNENFPIVNSDIVYDQIIEILIVVTSSMRARFGDRLNQYILNNIAIAMRVLRHSSLKASIGINVVDIIPLDPEYEKRNKLDDWTLIDQEHVLHIFCKWVNQLKKNTTYVWDSAILINDGYFCCSAIGIAHLRSICAPNNCLALVDRGFGTGYIIAHEIAHQMNAPHDYSNEIYCKRFEKSQIISNKINTVMATSLYFENFPFVWSNCSQAAIDMFLKSPDSSCLRRQNTLPVLYTHENILEHLLQFSTGREFNLNEQCTFALREPAVHCTNPKHVKLCSTLFCTSKRYSGCVRAQAVIADGTKCDHNKHCIHGKCLSIHEKVTAINGGWSRFGSWSTCSRSCGGGIQFSYRECNNPKPKLGGRYCVGARERIRSCSIRDCDKEENTREKLCAKLGLKAFIPKVDNTAKCELICLDESNKQVEHDMLLTDGTLCSPDREDICVRGNCFKTGCDRIVGSSKVYDNCGYCGGDNSTCERVDQVFDNSMSSTKSNMYWAFKVSDGISNFYLEKRAQRKTALSAMIYDDYTIMLMINRNMRIRRSKSIERIAGGILTYSGSDKPTETLFIKGKLKQEIEILISRENPYTKYPLPILYYHYYRPISDVGSVNGANRGQSHRRTHMKYVWRYLPFYKHDCYGKCEARFTVNSACYDKKTNKRVSDFKCRLMFRPTPKIIDCSNSMCGLRWKRPSNEYTEKQIQKTCPARCGSAKIRIDYFCQKDIAKLDSNDTKWMTVPIETCFKSGLTIAPYMPIICKGDCKPVKWTAGSWGNCSVVCGPGGYQYRNVTCKDSNGRIWSDNECFAETNSNGATVQRIDSPKPNTMQECDGRNCNSTYWLVGDWSECSSNCGFRGFKTRTVVCMAERNKENVEVDDWMCRKHVTPKRMVSCVRKECFHWIPIEKKCSVTCGKGVTVTSFVCARINLPNEYYDDKDCKKQGLEKPADIVKPCQKKKCYQMKWIPLSWGKCSKSCGNDGVKYRDIQCGLIASNNSVIRWIDTKNCQNKPKPNTSERCPLTHCPSWSYSPWSKCKGTCLFGKQYRISYCYNTDKNYMLPNAYCNQSIPHKTNRTCLLFETCGYWKVSEWSHCSVSCGVGIKTRLTECYHINGTISTDKSMCRNPAPLQKVLCETKPCENHKPFLWLESNQCNSYGCKRGLRYAQVKCVNRLFNILPDMMCGRELPIVRYETECFQSHCIKPQWYASDWDRIQCHVNNCIMKIKKRPVTCMDDYGEVLEDKQCQTLIKPDHWRLCPSPRKCSDIPRNCKELKQRHPQAKDGEYSLAIDLNWTYFIYCADMNTENPKEYLTLHKFNYARSSRFVKLPKNYTCLFRETTSEENCNGCMENNELFSITYYNKVRINLTDLSIDIFDTRFSKTNGLAPIPFGTAKDCSGSKSCPRGHFKIDLSGTKLSVSLRTSWWERHSDVSHKISRTKASKVVTGWCGGNCNGCSPISKLYVEPQIYGRDFESTSFH